MALTNRISRIVVALLAIPILLFLAYAGKLYFLFFVLFVGLGSFYEFSLMLKNKGIPTPIFLGEFIVALLILNSYFAFVEFRILILLIPVFVTFYELFNNNKSPIINIGSSLLGIFYIGLLSSSLIDIREFFNAEILYHRGGFLVISLFVSLWLCDSAAYFLGTSFGKHKIFPRISPKKSWEGSVAGLIFSLLGMIVMHEFFLEFLSLSQAIILGIIFGSLGQVGDFIESMFKRDSGVKDSSAIIPGHGGIFDRFDSLLFSAPFLYLFLTLFF